MTVPKSVLYKNSLDALVTYSAFRVFLPYHPVETLMERDGPFTAMKRVFPVRSVGKIELIPLEEIRWIKGAANYVEIHAQNGKYMHRETLHNLTQQLDPSIFLRIHRSAIVNLNHIKEISSELGRFSLVTLRDGTELKIGNGYRDTLFSALNL